MSFAATTLMAAAARAGAAPASTSSAHSSRVRSFKASTFHGVLVKSFAAAQAATLSSSSSSSSSRNRGSALRVRAGGVDPESLAILQQRLGQRIQLEGDGADRLNAAAGQLLGTDGRVIDKAERKKVLKAEETNAQVLELAFDPEGLFKDVDETAMSMLIDKKLKQKEIELLKKTEDALKEEWKKKRAELEADRAARVQPTSHVEVERCRLNHEPGLTALSFSCYIITKN